MRSSALLATATCLLLAPLSLVHAAAAGEFNHWAFLPPSPPALPAGDRAAQQQGPIDQLVAARLEEAGLELAPAVDQAILLRRLSFDLIGLPPTYEEVQDFVHDPRPDAVERVVDRLLASPHFGERWARHWLDVARYADTKGYVFQESREYPAAFTYRDWVVTALNDDLPYDQFIRLQLAADQVGEENDLAAMGFLTLGRRFLNNRHDIIDDRIDVVTRGLMGLTVSCARCHDHKYDPIPSADYYALYGVFASSAEPGDEPGPLRLIDKPKPVDARIFERGNPGRPGEQVPRRFLAALTDGKPTPFQTGSGRLELAQQIADADNPLTARVWVNRIWQQLFGRGLVETPSDFGTRSDPPLHQRLLDWLAIELIENDWSTKHVIRQIVLSRVYRQTAEASEAACRVDPENLLFSRRSRRRLDLEALRDAVLSVAGQLDEAIGGPPVDLLKVPYSTRRTLYGRIERQNLPAFYRTFDFASPDAHAPHRYETTVPLQALFLMNHPFMLEQAAALAARSGDDQTEPAERVEAMYRDVFARDPSREELQATLKFIASAADEDRADSPFDDWAQLAQALLMSNEFYLVD